MIKLSHLTIWLGSRNLLIFSKPTRYIRRCILPIQYNNNYRRTSCMRAEIKYCICPYILGT